ARRRPQQGPRDPAQGEGGAGRVAARPASPAPEVRPRFAPQHRGTDSGLEPPPVAPAGLPRSVTVRGRRCRPGWVAGDTGGRRRHTPCARLARDSCPAPWPSRAPSLLSLRMLPAETELASSGRGGAPPP